ncbi:divergent polysaccharide deacetylase family protein [Oleispirillum naphthae]|uniref:divergent polysaccharide deacetylase family protein n=1 Tax=Oleispirillum naphthae TaxID=2838853 RepID=UPI0030826B86
MARTPRKPPRRRTALATLRRFAGKRRFRWTPGLAAACLAVALSIGAVLGWWGASRILPHVPAPQRAAVQPPPPPPMPQPQAKPAEPEPEPQVSALPPPAETPSALPAWRRNAVPFTPVAGKPMIAIVIDDMGVDARRSAQVIALSPRLTTSFLTYARNLPAQAAAAHAAGHELLLHMPMEPSGSGYDPGPDVLLTAMPPETIRERLRQSLASFSGYVGINNHMGSKFTADAAAMRVVMEELRADGLLFLDSLTSGKSVGGKTARAEGVPALVRDVFLDDSPDPAAIRAQLRRVEEHARKTGRTIAIGHPRDTTIAALRDWLPEAEAQGFQFVPLSALAKAKSGE